MRMTRRNLILGAGAGAVAAGGAIAAPMLMRDYTLGPARSRALPVPTLDTPPPAADVVIIGAGMIGVASALYLAEKGLSVVICEKGEVGCEQSSRAYGQVTSYGLPELTELIQHSKFLWSGLNGKLGVDTSYRAYGRVQACATEADVAAVQVWLDLARPAAPPHAPIRARFLSGDELARRLPGARTPWLTALLQEDDGGMEPSMATSVLARAAQARGVKIVTRCAVRGVETQAGAVHGVVTEKGAIRASTVVLAAGSWARLFGGNAGVDLPLLPVYLSQQRISAVAGAPPACGAAGVVVWRQELDGSYSNGPRYLTAPIIRDSFVLAPEFLLTLPQHLGGLHLDLGLGRDLLHSLEEPRSWALDQVSPFERARVTAPNANDAYLDLALGWLRAEFPVFQGARVLERWGGILCVANDMNPIISAVSGRPGLFVAAGFDFGLTQGPAAGQLMADLVTGDHPHIDPTPFRLERFSA